MEGGKECHLPSRPSLPPTIPPLSSPILPLSSAEERAGWEMEAVTGGGDLMYIAVAGWSLYTR